MRYGTVTLQANDFTDIFYVTEVSETGVDLSDEALLGVEDPQFESSKPWVTGNVPQFDPTNIDGDTGLINAWFKGEQFTDPFFITVYVECELAEELISVEEKKMREIDDKSDLEPQEVNL